MKFDRSSGILLHRTSLPGPYGIGDLSLNARKWIDFLGEAGCALWQVLPLGPTGYGDSPYQCFSAFAGNPYLISPDILHADGFLDGDDIDFPPPFPPGHVDYGQVIQWKLSILDRAYDHFQARATATLMAEYEKLQFEKASWLDDFALKEVIHAGLGDGAVPAQGADLIHVHLAALDDQLAAVDIWLQDRHGTA